MPSLAFDTFEICLLHGIACPCAKAVLSKAFSPFPYSLAMRALLSIATKHKVIIQAIQLKHAALFWEGIAHVKDGKYMAFLERSAQHMTHMLAQSWVATGVFVFVN